MDEVVRLQALDGVWEVGGADRARGVWPEGLQCTWDKWGAKTARFDLRREPGAVFPDLTAFTPIEIEKGDGLWEGFVDQTPGGDARSLSVEALGWQDHADDDVYQRAYVHSRLGDWSDVRSSVAADLASFQQMGRVEAGDGLIVLGYPSGVTVPAAKAVGVTLDLGPGNGAKRIVIDYDTVGAFGGFVIYARSHDAPGGAHPASGGWSDAISGVAMTTASPQSGTFLAPRRYVTLFLYTGVQQGPVAGDLLLRLKSIRVFTSTAYESGGQSILTATDVLKDGLKWCPLWSRDTSGIEQTAFAFGDLAPTEPRTFREYAALVQMVHRYLLKLGRGRRLLFRPVATVPLVTAREGPGLAARDLSKNAGRELYNRAVGQGTDSVGQPTQVERYAAQQPGVSKAAVDSPAPFNPSFATDASSWVRNGTGTFARDTAVFDTTPASGKWDAIALDSTLDETFSGTFKRGVLYELVFRLRSTDVGETAKVQFGDFTASPNDYAEFVAHQIPGSFTEYSIAWVPKVDSASGRLRLTYLGEETD